MRDVAFGRWAAQDNGRERDRQRESEEEKHGKAKGMRYERRFLYFRVVVRLPRWLLVGHGFRQARIRAAPQWNPAPRPAKAMRAPGFTRPALRASCSAMGMVAAVVLP